MNSHSPLMWGCLAPSHGEEAEAGAGATCPASVGSTGQPCTASAALSASPRAHPGWKRGQRRRGSERAQETQLCVSRTGRGRAGAGGTQGRGAFPGHRAAEKVQGIEPVASGLLPLRADPTEPPRALRGQAPTVLSGCCGCFCSEGVLLGHLIVTPPPPGSGFKS